MKRKMNFTLNLFCAVCYGLCAAIWLGRAFTGKRGFSGIVGLVWLAGAVIWIVRTVREFREKPEQTTDETNHI